MKTEQRQRVHELFIEALHRSPSGRAALLDERCVGDPALRAEVESLLTHDAMASPDFLRPPEPHARFRRATHPAPADPLIGKQVGSYTVKEVIASGGMGTVYLAEQDRPRRLVALKVMRAGLTSQSALRRFEYESEILGRLRHPNIAQVYEAGTFTSSEGVGPKTVRPAKGLPYFAMEYLRDAKTLTQYANENKLSLRDRLAMFATVCEAVHYGHQKGIIHRDLKPANILVAGEQSRDRPSPRLRDRLSPRLRRGIGRRPSKTDRVDNNQVAGDSHPRGPLVSMRGSDLSPQAQVKIIDFGVARATDSDVTVTTMGTDVGQLLGTLQYMSPEQCDADPHDLDIRSDVYSLGVVLYELLTGSLPYHASSMSIYRATRTIKEQEPRRPSSINVKLRGDVETIVLKALEKDRAQRYQSAAGMGFDIRRYLAGEPIAARPTTAWTHVCHFVSRHPLVATTGMCLAIAAVIVAGTYVSVRLYNFRPYRLVLYRNGDILTGDGPGTADEVRLIARSGREIKTWSVKNPRGYIGAKMVDRPAVLGGGRLAILLFSIHSGTQCAGAVCAFDVDDDLNKPLWQCRIAKADIAPAVLKLHPRPQPFSPRLILVDDVFPEMAGQEIVIVYVHGDWSQQVLCIYDLQGHVLYEMWQDGGIDSAYWMSGARLLVCTGGDEYLKWHDPRFARLQLPFARVVFAIRPVLGGRVKEFLHSTPGDGPADPAWYKVLLPPEASVGVLCRLNRPSSDFDPGRFANYTMIFFGKNRQSIGGLNWVIDEHGDLLPETRVISDNYALDQKSAPPQLPDPDTIHLEDFPARDASPSN